MATDLKIQLKITEEEGIERRAWPFTRGVPLPAGALSDLDALYLKDPQGNVVPAQFRVLSRWPDKSLKWVLADFQAEVPAGGEATCTLHTDGAAPNPAPAAVLRLEEDDERIMVDTGALRFAIGKQHFGLFEFAELKEGPRVASEGGEAWVRICESSADGETQRYIYGMGGNCLASLGREEYQVRVEEAGPLRAVIRCEGAFEADAPMHHYAGYRPFRFILRIYAYAGQAFVRVLHTVVVTCNPRETEVEEIGVRVLASLSGTQRCRVASRRPREEDLEPGQSLVLGQRLSNHFRLERRAGGHLEKLAEGERTEGWMTVEDEQVGVGVGLRYMAEEYPKALETAPGGQGIEVYLWRDPDGGRLDFRRYAEEVAWHEGEGVYADGTGTAKTSEFFVCFYPTSRGEQAIDCLRGLLAPPHLALDPAWGARCEATGGFAPFDLERFPASERMMAGFLDWLERTIQLNRWYGFFDWGDVLVAWEEEKNDWRFRGRWGWCNSEWDPRHGVWIQYLRTGASRHFRLGEAMTRHSVDVDTCHFHPLRPYMVGGCFRHSVDHFGDEPGASHTFVDNWVDYYYLTGDLRTLEVLREAGEFFLRFRWTEDPRFSFSLRSIANTLRGLLYLYELTGEERFFQRAEEVYDTIARGQNQDGSWHKRFQVSTPDRLSDQAPYGMATEGTTLAVEMGTADPFFDQEFLELRGTFMESRQVLPISEQKGYQTHYLMIGLELLHRLTGREDVAEVYTRAVDWFCGYPEPLNAEFALQQIYGGVLCRHLGYAYRLTHKRRYLEIGKAVLGRLIDMQNWSDDPKRRGAVGQSPMYISLLFFGVPYMLGALQEAGMEEGE